MISEYVRIDMRNYARKDHFNYFKSMHFPYVGVTANVDITGIMKRIKDNKLPFFLTFLWHIAKSANSVPELRQRIYEDTIIEYSKCSTSHTVAKDDGTFSYCTLDGDMPLDIFIPYAKERQDEARVFGNIDEDKDASLSLFFASSLPWLSYTSLIQPVPEPADTNPRITWGKYFEQGDRILIPVSLLCHHALVDGLHIANFYKALDELNKSSI